MGKVYGNELSFKTTFTNPTDTNIYATYTVADRKMLDEALAKGQDLTKYCTSKVTDMSFMSNNATSFNQDIGNWDVSNVTLMDGMFRNANSFNQDLTQWYVTSIPGEPFSFSGGLSFKSGKQTLMGTCPE